MKMRRLVSSFACAAAILALCFALARAQGQEPVGKGNNDENYARLLSDLVLAYEAPTGGDMLTIESDLDSIRAVNEEDYGIARAIAEHWRRVYLDPDYQLYLYGGGELAEELADTGIPDSETHAIVVLGYELKNGQMQPELAGRCEAAAAAARSYPSTILVCSGGATGSNNPDRHTEAGLMKEYLTKCCGIDAERIFIDEKAMSTKENAVNTLKILQKKGVHTMTVVTSSYHQRWGQAVYHAVAELNRRENGYSVEIVANYCYDTEPSVEIYRRDDRFAALQIAGILGLSREATAMLPDLYDASPSGAGKG